MHPFADGLWDSLFGKRIEVELSDADGKPIRRMVTQKWFRRMVAAGHLRRHGPPEAKLVNLLTYARGAASATLGALQGAHPALRSMTIEFADLFVSVAGVAAAWQVLRAADYDTETQASALAQIEASLTAWDHRAVTAFRDATDFFRRAAPKMQDSPPSERVFAFGDILAMWVLWNFYDSAPAHWTHEQRAPVRTMGVLIIRPFTDYWQ